MGEQLPRTSRLYSCPRRFDLATMLTVTFAFALLFLVLRSILLPPTAVLTIAAFISSVGIGQAVLFNASKPRLASALTGSIILPVLIFIATWPETYVLEPALFGCLLYGLFLGYLAGALVGSVFLIADVLRRLIRRLKSE